MPRSAPDPRRHQVLASTSRLAVLEVLRRHGAALGIEDVAAGVGLHVNTVRTHLDLLVGSGLVSRRAQRSAGPGRPRTLYQATAAPESGTNYQLLADILMQHIAATAGRPGAAAAQAGRDWARAAGRPTLAPEVAASAELPPATGAAGAPSPAVADVVRMLADHGFAPRLSQDGLRIDVHHCPFRELAETNQEVVCAAHLGLLQGALAELGAPVDAVRLRPFVEPSRCVATLAPRPAR